MKDRKGPSLIDAFLMAVLDIAIILAETALGQYFDHASFEVKKLIFHRER